MLLPLSHFSSPKLWLLLLEKYETHTQIQSAKRIMEPQLLGTQQSIKQLNHITVSHILKEMHPCGGLTR